jgi:CDP-diacylglycerol--serine O-phosphatidyltransferase
MCKYRAIYMIKKNLANFFTLLNLLAGILAVVSVFHNDFRAAFLWVTIGILFDFADGFVARLTGTSSELGLQLDSLADLVTSGLVPAFFLMKLWQMYLSGSVWPYFFLLIALGSAYRLAKFNIDSRQKTHFIGLPTPANALFLLATGMALTNLPGWFENKIFLFGIPVLLTLVSVWLLNAELPLLSLKVSQGSFSARRIWIFLTVVSVVSVYFFKFQAAWIILPVYIFLSVYHFKIRKS